MNLGVGILDVMSNLDKICEKKNYLHFQLHMLEQEMANVVHPDLHILH